MGALWDFAIDVGGTFTDCLATTPAGETRRHKTLSSGLVKGRVGAGSTPTRILDPLRGTDPAGFWIGATLSLLDAAGRAIASTRVAAFDAADCSLEVVSPLPSLAEEQPYELDAGYEAPVLCIRYVLATPPGVPTPPVRLRLGTTRGTNALLTRTGARTALAVTRGFGDLLEIGYQDRPRLFDLAIRKSRPLAERSIEIAERVAADGRVMIAPDERTVRGQFAELRAAGIESLAICLLHADLYPAHEMLFERIARDVGFAEISRSSGVAPLVKIVARGDTTVVDAYLNPVLRDYVGRLERDLPGSQVRLMTSAGGLKSACAFRGFESVLSGPAGGVVGYARAAQAAGRPRAIGFDMGGTSTDVSRFDGQFEYEYETQKAGVRLVAPTLAIETVAAGGGSICAFDGVKLTVGPASAGANPGPACYGRGGPLCVTDLNLYLGRLVAERFPFPTDRRAVERRLDELRAQVAAATGEPMTPVALAEGLLAIANANMARAIHNVTVARGDDPRDYAMAAFGGAAGQHACAVASDLGIAEILHDADASLLSARGIGLADVTRHGAAGIYRLAEEFGGDDLTAAIDYLAAPLVDEVAAEGIDRQLIEVVATADVRYRGVDAAIAVSLENPLALAKEFERAHRRQFGYAHADRAIEIAAVRVEVIGRLPHRDEPAHRGTPYVPEPATTAEAVFRGVRAATPVFDRGALHPGAAIVGPALIAEPHTTTVIDPRWSAELLPTGQLLLTHAAAAPRAGGLEPDLSPSVVATAPQAVRLEVFNNLLAGIAEQMGHMLRRTALSVNVKERLDYSCAVFTADGELAASAAHIPVHLGAMGATVRAIVAENADMRPGDAYVTNDPYRGGSHLPDVTVVLPVYLNHASPTECHWRPASDEARTESAAPTGGEAPVAPGDSDLPPATPFRTPAFFTACRAHHPEIGGARPGSMPPRATRLAEEGVVISNFLLVRHGVVREAELRELLTAGPYPSRAVEENLADVAAQLAAVQQGAAQLRQLVERCGCDVVEQQMQAILAASEAKVRAALARLPPGERRFTDSLDLADGSSVPIAVAIAIPPEDAGASSAGPAATIDFTGTAPAVPGNLNANAAITSAAVLYALRLLVDEDIPLNEGALRAVEIVLPPCLLNPPVGVDRDNAPAVAAGNVETSLRIVDVLLGALGLAAASQGTMNNVLFGNEEFGFYETVCGGSGATPEADGASAVQVHMTNTRSTDPEVLERRLPVRLWEFSIRRGSGGAGRTRGGDGAVRRIEFLAPLELSLITQRRGAHPPFGLAGGESGASGENWLHRADSAIEQLPGIAERTVYPGDILEIRTPAGGGYGK